MLTIFAAPKAFTGIFATLQRNAIGSWLQLKPKPQVILFGNEAGVAEIAGEFGLLHVPDIAVSSSRSPILSAVFHTAQDLAKTGLMAFVNSDIILFQEFMEAAVHVSAHFKRNFLMIGRRTDFKQETLLDFTAPDWASTLRAQVKAQGRPHGISGIDFFVFPRNAWRGMPDFVIGRPAYDNWLVGKAIAKNHAVVDVSADVLTVHQNHVYNQLAGGFKEIREGAEAKNNRSLCQGVALCDLRNAQWALVKRRIITNDAKGTPAAPPRMTDYMPRLRYLFCVPRVRSLISQKAMIQYLNSCGIVPDVILSNQSLRRELTNISVNYVHEVTNRHDILFTESAGMDNFERECLEKSFKAGKVNLKVANSISIYNKVVNPNYTPERTTGKITGMCAKDKRTCDHFRLFNNTLAYWNVGDPDWDIWRTAEFDNAINEIWNRYGEKLLVVGTAAEEASIIQEYEWLAMVRKEGMAQGYRVLFSPHPGRIPQVQKFLASKGWTRDIECTAPRHALFAAASHMITDVNSSVIAECLLLGTPVAGNPLLCHIGKWGNHKWITDDAIWREIVTDSAGQEIIDLAPAVLTQKDLQAFLATETCAPPEKVKAIFGIPAVDHYTGNLFHTVDTNYCW